MVNVAESVPYSVAELMQLTGLSRNTIYEACRSGEIPHRRVLRRIIFPRTAIDSWLANAGEPTEPGA